MKHLLLTFFTLSIIISSAIASESIINTDSLIIVHLEEGDEMNDSVHVKLLVEIGDNLRDNSPDSAIYYFNEALKIAEKLDNENRTAGILSRIGGTRYIQGDYDKALDCFIKSLNISRNIKNTRGIAVGLNNVGLIYNMLGKNEEALENHINSALLCAESGDSNLLAINYLNIGVLNQSMHNYDTALAYVNKSAQINELLHNENQILKLNNIRGHILIDKGDYLFAKHELFKVINKNNYNKKWELSYAYTGLASVEQKLGNIDQSIIYGKKGIQLAKEIQAKWDIQLVTKILSDSYAKLGKFEEAYNYHLEHKIYSDSIFNEEQENRINYLKLKQEDFEYIMLSKENYNQSERLQKKNIQILIFALGILFLILIAVILYRINHIKSKLNTQLINKNAEIDNKNKQLVKLNATKDTLFRIIGHDVKSPLSTVVSFTDLLQSNYNEFSQEEILEYVSITNKSAHNAINLLENLLEWAKSQTGITTVKPSKTNISQLIEEVTNQLNNNIVAKNISLIVDVPNDITAVLDKNMTASIIRNLLSNSIKFTRENGVIKINAQKDNLNVLISVVDNGIGISKEKLDTLFQIENISSSLGTKNEKGTGIGLILCKDFTEKQGGEIWAESDPGKGSTFYLRL